jgi:hypothetical protein
MGFHLESARAVVIDGQPAVQLRLSDGSHYATVTEQHPAKGEAAGPGSGAQAAAGPGEGVPVPAGGQVQTAGGSPWSATYRAPGMTFTYVSDLPSDRADDALPILQKLGSRAAAGLAAGTVTGARPTASGEPLGPRLQRGMNNLAALFGR